jgi:DNA polymerase-1
VLETPDLNPDSRIDLLAALRRAGLDVDDTRASTLHGADHPAVEVVLRYKQLAQLAKTNGWAWSDQWVSAGRFRPSYQPAGSATGRWSSNGGGALSLPLQVRGAAVADPGWRLVVADVAQLEPRALAGMSGDHALAASARGADLYQSMADDGAVSSRLEAKMGLLGAMYGATSGESGRLVASLTRRYPRAFGLVEEAARAGERGEVVRTLLGRGAPRLGEAEDRQPDDPAVDPDSRARDRRAYGRFTRNFVVQGTGAEWALCWIADLRNRLWDLAGAGAGTLVERPHLVFFLHDEVVVHTPAELADAVSTQMELAAATASALLFRDLAIDFPLTTSVVESYADAGKAGTQRDVIPPELDAPRPG